MYHLRNAIKSRVSVRTMKPTQALPSFLGQPLKRFSTGTDQPQTPPLDASVDRFLDSSSKGFAYAKLTGTTKNTMKSDVINLLDGCNLTADDVKVIYNPSLFPAGMMLRFSSDDAFRNAGRIIRRFTGRYWLEKVNGNDWDIVKPYDGKTVILQGVPRNATMEDVERFLCGCDFDSIQMFSVPREGTAGNIKVTAVQFPSKIQAMNAFISRNRNVFLNYQISVRVLH